MRHTRRPLRRTPATVLAGWILTAAACAHPQQSHPPVQGAAGNAPTVETSLIIADPLLENRILLLAERSVTWRVALDSLRDGDFHIIVARPEQVRSLVKGLERYEAKHFGEVIPLRDRRGVIVGAVVTVDVTRLTRLCRALGMPPTMIEPDVDRILIHEIYGHVVPLAAARTIPGGCPDPRPGEPVTSSCAITRENVIRAELGLEPRTSYDLRGLAIGRQLYMVGGEAGLLEIEPF